MGAGASINSENANTGYLTVKCVRTFKMPSAPRRQNLYADALLERVELWFYSRRHALHAGLAAVINTLQDLLALDVFEEAL